MRTIDFRGYEVTSECQDTNRDGRIPKFVYFGKVVKDGEVVDKTGQKTTEREALQGAKVLAENQPIIEEM